MKKRYQYYEHYLDLPNNFTGIELSGSKQYDRALSLIGVNESRYFLENIDFKKFRFWLAQPDINGIMHYVQTGKKLYEVMLDGYKTHAAWLTWQEGLREYHRIKDANPYHNVTLWSNVDEKPIIQLYGKERYSVLVSHVGWILKDEPNRKKAENLYEKYCNMRKYSQVSLWCNLDNDPLLTHEMENGLE